MNSEELQSLSMDELMELDGLVREEVRRRQLEFISTTIRSENAMKFFSLIATGKTEETLVNP